MKMSKKIAILAAVAAILLFAGLALWGPSKTPPTQKPLLALSAANFNEFGAEFDEVRDAPRLVLLLSPT